MRSLFRSSILIFSFLLFWFGQIYAAEIDSLSVEPARNQAASRSIHIFHLSFADSIRSDSQLRVTYPQDFDLSLVKLAGSNTIKGGFSVQVSGQTIVITRSGSGYVLSPGVMYDLAIANVINGPEGNYNITVQVLNRDGTALGDIKTANVNIIP